MSTFPFDTETYLIAPGRAAPNVVCLTWRDAPGHGRIVTWKGARAVYVEATRVHEHIVAHHASFDHAAMCATYPELVDLIFDLYDANRVRCTMRGQQMLDTAAGKRQGYRSASGKWVKPAYNLADLAARFLGKTRFKADVWRCAACGWVSKKELATGACVPCGQPLDQIDSWRLRYSELALVPLEEWPADAVQYAIDDAIDAGALDDLQQVHAAEHLKNQYNKARSFFALELMKVWGLRTNYEGVKELERRTKHDLEDLQAFLVDEKLVRPDGSRDTKAAARRMMRIHAAKAGLPFEPIEAMDPLAACALLAERTKMKLTDTGKVCLDKEACEDSEDNVLEDYAEFTTCKNVINKDVAALLQGVTLPIHTRYDSLATDRTSSSGPNVQNWKRIGRIRECFIPRPGHVYLQGDFEGFELCSLAETCLRWLGKSALAEALNAGKDVHSMLGGNMIQLSYDEMIAGKKRKDPKVANARQAAKPGNFGFPGGLGFDAFRAFSKTQYKVIFSHEEAQALKNTWLRTWPEMIAYFAYIRSKKGPGDLYEIEPLYFGQKRGGCLYTAACNTPFQALAANTMQYVLWHITRACYRDRTSPLYAVSRNVNEVHDEYFLEVPEDERLHERAQAFSQICNTRAAECMPLVPPKLEPVVMRYWSKSAHAMHDADGRIIPWSLEECNCNGCTEEKIKLGWQVAA